MTRILGLMAVLSFGALSLGACGGGGGGDDDDPPVGPLDPLRTVALSVRIGSAPNGDERLELTSLDGGPSASVSPPGVGEVGRVRWSPSHQLFAFLAGDPATDSERLYVVDPATLVAVEVSDGIPAAAAVWEFEWSPQADRLAFTASVPGVAPDGWIVGADGTGLVKRFMPFSGPSSTGIEHVRWSPDGTSLAYLDASVDLDSPSLWLGDPSNGFAFTLASPDDGSLAGVDSFAWSPDGLRIALRGELDTVGATEAYVVPASGAGPLARLHAPLVAGLAVRELSWAPNGSRVALHGDLLVNGRNELFTASPTGGTATPINGTLVAGGDVDDYFWSPNSLWLAYVADQTTDQLPQLFARPPEGSGTPTEVSLASEGIVTEVEWAPDSSRLGYAAASSGITMSVHVRAPGPGAGLRVSAPTLATPGRVGRLVWSPQSNRIAFTAEHSVDLRADCYVATMASASAVLVSDFSAQASGDSDCDVHGFDSTGTRVIYTQGDDATNQAFLFSDLGDGASRRTLAGPFPYVLFGGIESVSLR